MKIQIILNAAFALALVFLSYRLWVANHGEHTEQDSAEVVLNSLLKRASVRA